MSQQLKEFFSNLGQFVSDPSKLCPKVAKLSQQLHTNIRDEEIQYGLTKPKAALHQLYIDGMDHDQIFEQLAANDDDLLNLDKPSNLCMQVSDLKMAAEADCSRYQLLADAPSRTADADGESEDSALSDDEGMEQDDSDDEEYCEQEEEGVTERDTSSGSLDEGMADGDSASERDSEDENTTQSDDGSNNDSDAGGEDDSKDDKSDDSSDSIYEDLDAQLFKKYMKTSDSEDEGNESECGDLAMGSEGESEDEATAGREDADEDEDDEDASRKGKQADGESDANKSRQNDSKPNSLSNPLSSITVPGFSKTRVDSGFFNVRESEWIADEDIIGANNFDDIDFMEDIEGSDEKATYKDFFDDGPPTMSKKKSKKRKGIESQQPDKDDNDEDGGDSWGMDEDEEPQQSTEAVSRTAPDAAQESQSRLEAELTAEARLREQLEESNVAPKPWELRGEVKAQDRPTNSVLTQYLEYRSGARYRPELNEDLTRRLEKIAVDRFRTKAFDSVERKAKIVDNPFEFKKKIVLEQEKSTKSLSKIYEEEFLKKQKSDAARDSGEEEAQFKLLRAEFTDIQELLRALSNAHYTPKMSQAEVKIVSNQPALRVEEATPLVVGDADMLAPQEILAPVRGDVKGDTEKTSTDRKRERRTKKHLQHLKHKRQEEKTNDKIKKAAKLGKKLDIDTSTNVVKKAIKIGTVKMMDNKGADVKGFFKQMNELSSKSSSNPAKKRKWN